MDEWMNEWIDSILGSELNGGQGTIAIGSSQAAVNGSAPHDAVDSASIRHRLREGTSFMRIA